VLDRMHEAALRRGSARGRDRIPPVVVGDLHDPAAEPLDRSELRLSRALRDDHRARNAELSCGPGDALTHVARTRGDDPVAELALRDLFDRVERSAQLERADRLQVLELEVDLCGSLGYLEADERCSQDCA